MLLSPKLSRPRLSTPLVARERLLSELEAVRSHPLTLVSASAGSGKTTLLSTWAALFSQLPECNRAEPMLVWLSLDELDNDPIRFWTAVIVALRTCLPHCGQRAVAMLHSSESPPLSTVLMTLLQDLVEEDSDIILILDDYHVISDQAIVDSMRFLLDHLAANLHLVLATRTDPELPLSRWRVRSQLIEIRDRDLRFTEGEAASFLTQGMGLPLSEAEVGLIERRLRVLRALIEVTAIIKRGDQERMLHLALEIEALPQDEEARWNLISLYFTFWRIALLQGEGASLIPKLLVAKQQMLGAGDSLVTIRVMTWLAFAYIQAAQLHLAQQECLETLALIEQSGARTIMAGYVYHFLFQISYAWNRLEEAADWLHRLQHIAHEIDGTSRLFGPLQDQPALYGVLTKISRLNLTLLSLESSELTHKE